MYARAQTISRPDFFDVQPAGEFNELQLYLVRLRDPARYWHQTLQSCRISSDKRRIVASQPINDGAKSSEDNKGQAQPQGTAGPLTTGTDGATAANPQGGTPPNMQAVPEGSTTSVDRK